MPKKINQCCFLYNFFLGIVSSHNGHNAKNFPCWFSFPFQCPNQRNVKTSSFTFDLTSLICVKRHSSINQTFMTSQRAPHRYLSQVTTHLIQTQPNQPTAEEKDILERQAGGCSFLEVLSIIQFARLLDWSAQHEN